LLRIAAALLAVATANRCMPFPFALHRLADGLALHALAIALAIPLVKLFLFHPPGQACARIDFNAAHKKDFNQQRLIVGCFTVLVVRVTLIVLVPARLMWQLRLNLIPSCPCPHPYVIDLGGRDHD
jgi:hypothetical protein